MGKDTEFTIRDALDLRGLDAEEVLRNVERGKVADAVETLAAEDAATPVTDNGWFVDIRNDATGEVAEHMGPLSERQAQRVARGASINMHEDWSAVIVPPTAGK